MGDSVVVLCIVLMTALYQDSPLHGSGKGGKQRGVAILHIHIAFVAQERGTFIFVLWIVIKYEYCN